MSQWRFALPTHLSTDSDWALADGMCLSLISPSQSFAKLNYTQATSAWTDGFIAGLLDLHNIRPVNVLIQTVCWWTSALRFRHRWGNYLLKWSNIPQWMSSILKGYDLLLWLYCASTTSHMSKTTTCWNIIIYQSLTHANSCSYHPSRQFAEDCIFVWMCSCVVIWDLVMIRILNGSQDVNLLAHCIHWPLKVSSFSM